MILFGLKKALKSNFLDFIESMSQAMMTRTSQKAKKSVSTRYDVICLSFSMNIPFRRSKSSKAATPKRPKMNGLSLSELAGSPSTSASAWKDSFNEGLRSNEGIRSKKLKSKLVLDDSVFAPLLSTPEKDLKKGKDLEKVGSVLEESFAVPEIQAEAASVMDVSAGRVSLWVIWVSLDSLVRV